MFAVGAKNHSGLSIDRPMVIVLGPEPDPALLKRIRVTAYDVLNTSISEDHNEARVTVEIRYYDEERMSEITLTDRQTWKYDEEEEYWYLASPLPAFQ